MHQILVMRCCFMFITEDTVPKKTQLFHPLPKFKRVFTYRNLLLGINMKPQEPDFFRICTWDVRVQNR